MIFIRKRYEIKGLGIERLLDGLKEIGVSLYDVQRVRAHCVRFSIPVDQCRQMEAYAEEHGFACQSLPDTGLLRRLRQIRKRWFLFLFMAMAAGALMLSLQFIWQIQVEGAGIYRGEVLQYLKEANIHPGVRKHAISLRTLSDDLQYRLPQIAWASAEIQGVSLSIRMVPGVPAPDLSANIGGRPSDIIAACDGVIQQMDVFAGTAMVKVGETVKKGQLLIAGKERNSLQETYQPVPARGQVTARVWLLAQAEVNAYETLSTPTGNTEIQYTFRCPWYNFSAQSGPQYLTADEEIERFPIGGAWVPLWLEKRTYTEVALERFQRPIPDLQAECGLAAMQKIFSLCNNKDEIIDKKINFSMIEGETIHADAYAELLTDIGRAVPQTLD